MVNDPESLDLLRLTEGKAFARGALVDDLTSEVAVLDHDQAVLAALRRFKRRETLRIAYGDIVRELPLATVATVLEDEREVVFREGDLFDAIRASISIPGVFTTS